MRRSMQLALSLAAMIVMTTLVLVGPAPGTAQEATPADCPETTPEQQVELARQWFEALASGSSEDVGALAAADVVYHAPSPDPPATDDAEEWADRRLQDYPDLTVTPEHIFAAGDMVAAYVWFAGTHSGDTEEGQGVPATGQMIEWAVMVHFRVDCGKFVEIWSVGDELGRLQRLGVITPEELQSVSPVATPMP